MGTLRNGRRLIERPLTDDHSEGLDPTDSLPAPARRTLALRHAPCSFGSSRHTSRNTQIRFGWPQPCSPSHDALLIGQLYRRGTIAPRPPMSMSTYRGTRPSELHQRVRPTRYPPPIHALGGYGRCPSHADESASAPQPQVSRRRTARCRLELAGARSSTHRCRCNLLGGGR